jgi:hypothetical protein
LEKLVNGGGPPENDTKLVNGVTLLANRDIGQRSGTGQDLLLCRRASTQKGKDLVLEGRTCGELPNFC